MAGKVAWVRVVRIERNQVRLGFDGPVEVLREELLTKEGTDDSHLPRNETKKAASGEP